MPAHCGSYILMGGGEAQQRIITINTLNRYIERWMDRQIDIGNMLEDDCILEKKINHGKVDWKCG